MKPITKGDLSSQTITPNKIATIFVASAETVRANPANYLNTMRTKVATAIAVTFDNAVIHGTDTPFGAYIDQASVSVSVAAGEFDDGAYKAIGVVGSGRYRCQWQQVDRHPPG